VNITAPRDFSQEEIAAINEKAMALLQEFKGMSLPDAIVARHLPRPFPIRRIDETEFADALTTPAKLMALLGRVSDGLQTIQDIVVTAQERAAMEGEQPIVPPAPANNATPATEPQPAPTTPKPAPGKCRPGTRSDEFDAERLKREIDIVALISKDTKLTKNGSEYTGLCPLPGHQEKTASFYVNPAKRTFHCFGCGRGGSVIDYVMYQENISSIHEACKRLAGADILPLRRHEPSPAPEPVDPYAGYVPVDPPANATELFQVGVETPRILNIKRTHEEKREVWGYPFKPSHVAPYRDATGKLLGFVLRRDFIKNGKQEKETPAIQYVQTPDGELLWARMHFGEPRPLYGLDRLAANPEHQVLAHEGEKKTDAGERAYAGAGLVNITWPGGAGAVDKADWAPVARRSVLFWPDYDLAGYQAVLGSPGKNGKWNKGGAELALEHGAAKVAMIDVMAPGEDGFVPTKEGWDCADAVAEGWDFNRTKGWIAQRKIVFTTVKDVHEAAERLLPKITALFAKPESAPSSTEPEHKAVEPSAPPPVDLRIAKGIEIMGGYLRAEERAAIEADRAEKAETERAVASDEFTEDDLNKVRGDAKKWAENPINEAVLKIAVLGERHPEWGVLYSRITDRTGLGKRPLNAWIKDYRDKLRRAAKQRKADEKAKAGAELGRLFLDPKAPYQTATTYLDMKHTAEGLRTLHFHRGDFYTYAGTHYREAEQDMLKQCLYRFLNEAYQADDSAELKPFNPDRNKVNDVFDAVRAETALSKDINAPAWLGDAEAIPFPAHEMISCRNGILNPSTRELASHTPEFFSPTCLEFDYDEDAPEPVEWLKFLDQLWGSDKESIETLQQMFGYLLTGDTSQQKIFMLIGPRRCGKGTIGRVLHKLLGPDNVTWPRLESLGTDFGCQPLIGKSAAIVSDLQLGDKANVQGIAATLLSVSGEDEQTINRKNKPHWTGRLATRFVLLTNKIPKLPDASGALPSRFIMLRFTESFEGREDLKLTDKLLSELTGIFNWALDGLDMLKTNVKFKEPVAAADVKEAFQDLTSPISTFIRERCVVGKEHSVRKDDLYAEWRKWSERQGRNFTTTKNQFSADLFEAEPGITATRPRGTDGKQVPCYQGIGLTRDDDEPPL
jgi:putative DNA primase/helicase